MSGDGKMRQRAVRLSPEAVELLKEALNRHWLSLGTTRKLTRDYKAELLKVSTVTAHRILNGQGVDRSSLLVAFKAVNLEWKEEYCRDPQNRESLETKVDLPPSAPAEPASASPLISVFEANPPVKLWWKNPRHLIAVAIIGTLLVVMGIVANLNHPVRAQAKPRIENADEIQNEFAKSFFISNQLYTSGRYYDGLRAIEHTIALMERGERPVDLAHCIRLRGDLHGALGNYEAALQDFNESLYLQKRFEKERTYPALYEAIGDLETKLGKLDAAQKSLLLSRDLYLRFKDMPGVAMAERDLGTVFALKGDSRQARAWFDSARGRISDLNQDPMQMDIDARDATVLVQIGRVEQGRTVLNRCLDFWQGQRHPRWVTLTQRQLAQAEFKLGNRDLAIDLLESSLGAYRSVGDTKGAAETEKWLKQYKPLQVADSVTSPTVRTGN